MCRFRSATKIRDRANGPLRRLGAWLVCGARVLLPLGGQAEMQHIRVVETEVFAISVLRRTGYRSSMFRHKRRGQLSDFRGQSARCRRHRFGSMLVVISDAEHDTRRAPFILSRRARRGGCKRFCHGLFRWRRGCLVRCGCLVLGQDRRYAKNAQDSMPRLVRTRIHEVHVVARLVQRASRQVAWPLRPYVLVGHGQDVVHGPFYHVLLSTRTE